MEAVNNLKPNFRKSGIFGRNFELDSFSFCNSKLEVLIPRCKKKLNLLFSNFNDF